MTLFKQIALVVLAIFILLFIIVLSVSFGVIKSNAQKSLYENAQNSATSIALSIAATGGVGVGNSGISTVINASFDNGNYEKILFWDVDKMVAHERVKSYDAMVVPKWFRDTISLEHAVAKAVVSSGWNVVGEIEVHADREVVYIQLYDMFTYLLLYLALALVAALAVLYLLLSLLLRPLEAIKGQAEAIMNNEFIINNKLPKTVELQALTQSMNTTVKKVEEIFHSANNAMKQNKELLYIDSTTKLYNRRYFALKASEYISLNSSYSKGLIVVLGITRAELLNKLIGYKNTDQFFHQIAHNLEEFFALNGENLIVRLNGTEFVAMIPSEKLDELSVNIDTFIAKVNADFEALQLSDDKVELHIGMCKYADEENIGKLFSKIDYTLSQAKITNDFDICEIESSAVAMGKEQWRSVVKEAITDDGVMLGYSDVVEIATQNVVYKDLNFWLKTSSGEFKYHEFIAPVVELRMLVDLYMKVVAKAVCTPCDAGVTIYLPFHLIECTQSHEKIKELFSCSDKVCTNVVFEISEDTLMKRYDCSLHMVEFLRSKGYEFAICNFIACSDDYEFLKVLKPKYIKASKNYIFDGSQNIALLKILTQSIGVEIVVTDVESDDEVGQLKDIGFWALKRS